MSDDGDSTSADSPSRAIARIKQLLEPSLPDGEEFTLIHVRSPPQKCRKLIFTSSKDPQLDTMTTHYFVIVHRDLAVVSLEVYTYESQDTFTIFISKADTTGHYQGQGRLNTMAVIQSLLRSVARYYSPANKRTRICLFAKAEGQYLFLGSIKNPHKHVLSDAQLVKWWIRCLDGIHDEFENAGTAKCTLAIPGISDSRAISTYFPPSASIPWTAGDIFWDAENQIEDDLTMAVKRIPRFPDDPKSRFLDSIVAEKRAKQVSRRQFWAELESRQEFRLGKSVGIIGLEVWLKKTLHIPCSKEETVSKRDCTRFKDLLLSLNFETIETTKLATEKLLATVPEFCKVELTGTYRPEQSSYKRKVADAPIRSVNTLGGGMIRKKVKTAL